MIETDEIDRKILEILSQDGRVKYTTIAKQINKTEGTVRNRVKRLRERGVIRGFKALIDPINLGYNVEAVMQITLDQNYDSIVNLEKIPEICDSFGVKLQTLYRISSQALTFIFEVHARNRVEIEKLMNKISTINGFNNISVFYKEEKLIDNLA